MHMVLYWNRVCVTAIKTLSNFLSDFVSQSYKVKVKTSVLTLTASSGLELIFC